MLAVIHLGDGAYGVDIRQEIDTRTGREVLEANDPRAFAAALVSLTLAALAASLIPARRAACVDPIVALRSE